MKKAIVAGLIGCVLMCGILNGCGTEIKEEGNADSGAKVETDVDTSGINADTKTDTSASDGNSGSKSDSVERLQSAQETETVHAKCGACSVELPKNLDWCEVQLGNGTVEYELEHPEVATECHFENTEEQIHFFIKRGYVYDLNRGANLRSEEIQQSILGQVSGTVLDTEVISIEEHDVFHWKSVSSTDEGVEMFYDSYIVNLPDPQGLAYIRFDCPNADREAWEETFEQIICTLRIDDAVLK